METTKGRALLDVYSTKQSFTDDNRNDLINIIVEDVTFTRKTLSPTDISKIVDEISTVFPTEKTVQVINFLILIRYI